MIFSITFGISRATFKKHETGIRSAMANALGIVSAAVKLEIPNNRRQVEADTLVVTVTARAQSKSVADRLSAETSRRVSVEDLSSKVERSAWMRFESVMLDSLESNVV